MNNPWLQIPLSDYEGHMASPLVGQAQLLSDVFAAALELHRPRAVAVLGCAGGNGFERIPPETVQRVVGVDLNPDYIEAARKRFSSRIPQLQLYVGDVASDAVDFAPVDLIYAGLLFEYVESDRVLARIHRLLRPAGMLVTVVQLHSPAIPDVTPSPFASLAALSLAMHLVAPEQLRARAAAYGLGARAQTVVRSSGSKDFCVQSFQRSDPDRTSREAG